MLYMIIESFKNRDPVPVYRRFRDQGRLAPESVKYISSWVTLDMTRCYQLMECEDRHRLDQWIARWSDLVDFEVVPAIGAPETVRQTETRRRQSFEAERGQELGGAGVPGIRNDEGARTLVQSVKGRRFRSLCVEHRSPFSLSG